RYSPMEQIWPGLDAASQKVITNSYDDRSERILKEPLDARSDIYSLGATLYFLATGSEPVDPLERSIDLLEGKLDPLREPTSVNSQIPPEISDVLMKALEIKRENRYDSAMIMRHVLQSAISRVQEREDRARTDQREASDLLRRAAETQAAPPPAPRVEEKPVEVAPPVERHTETAPPVEVRQNAEPPVARSERPVPTPAEPEVVAYRETESVDEAELAAVLKELEEAESRSSDAPEEAATAEVVLPAAKKPEAAPPVVVERPEVKEPDVTPAAAVEGPAVKEPEVERVETAAPSTPGPVVSTSSYEVDDDETIFSAEERTGFSLPMPAIAGAIGLVIMIAVGAWFAMSGSKTNEQPAAPAQTEVVVQQPEPVEAAPATNDPIVSSQSDPGTAAAAVTEPGQDEVAAQKAAAAPKPKKTEPAKAPEKKKVTVDDLINDN
ncbi:MAG TPA: hypothetical protein VJV05_11260, partial [Pyrinomonadaceae bacterium]|nr:hypothetical protein [Pyrinomonadaceae bacterium]